MDQSREAGGREELGRRSRGEEETVTGARGRDHDWGRNEKTQKRQNVEVQEAREGAGQGRRAESSGHLPSSVGGPLLHSLPAHRPQPSSLL